MYLLDAKSLTYWTAFSNCTDITDFDVLLTVHLNIILVYNKLNAQTLVFNKFIIFLYMFRALLCSTSGVQNCIIQHLVLSHSVGDRPCRRCRHNIDNVCTDTTWCACVYTHTHTEQVGIYRHNIDVCTDTHS